MEILLNLKKMEGEDGPRVPALCQPRGIRQPAQRGRGRTRTGAPGCHCCPPVDMCRYIDFYPKIRFVSCWDVIE